MVYTVYWLPIGGSVAQASWLGPKVGGHLAPFLYIHRVIRVNSRNGSAMMTAL